MKKQVFISYDFNDATYCGEVKRWLNQAGFDVIAVKEENLEPEPDSVGERRLVGQINDCFAVLVLVGNDTHNRPWVDYEVSVAQSKQKPVRWVRLTNRTGCAPREIRNQLPVPYTEKDIVGAVSQL